MNTGRKLGGMGGIAVETGEKSGIMAEYYSCCGGISAEWGEMGEITAETRLNWVTKRCQERMNRVKRGRTGLRFHPFRTRGHAPWIGTVDTGLLCRRRAPPQHGYTEKVDAVLPHRFDDFVFSCLVYGVYMLVACCRRYTFDTLTLLAPTWSRLV